MEDHGQEHPCLHGDNPTWNPRRLLGTLPGSASMYTNPACATLCLHHYLKEAGTSKEVLLVPESCILSAPGLQEDHRFKSLFLHNLQGSMSYDISMHYRTRNLTMQEIRKYAQMVWEIHVHLARRPGDDARVLGIKTTQETELALEGSKTVTRE